MEKGTNKIYGYVRVSTRYQNEERQLLAMKDKNVPKANIFLDKQSGKDFNRPAYQKLVRKLRTGDLLYIKSIDRLGRNYEEIIMEWRCLTKDKGVDIAVIDMMPLLDTRNGKDLVGTLISDIVLQLLSFVAENERNDIRQRQAEGIDAAIKAGVRFGRPEKELPKNYSETYKRWEKGELTATEAAEICNISRTSWYYYAKNKVSKKVYFF